MIRHGVPRYVHVLLVAALLTMGVSPGIAVAQTADQQAIASASAAKIQEWNAMMERSYISQDQREAAAARMKTLNEAASIASAAGVAAAPMAMPMPMPGMTPDYFESPNWAYSPIIRKFVDTLPGVGAAKANNLGNYIGVAHPDTVTYPGSDYYEIELREYEQKLHSDLPPTRLRGYVQTNNGTNPAVANPTLADNTVAPDPITYLGPFIQATKDRPVRVKFTNKLPTGAGGDLFIPVDTTVMGAGMGPLDMMGMPGMKEMYTQNRGTLHLHGGITPWISDGTPHQWITPAGENTQYPEGVSVVNVPDMPDPGDGSQTFFYTNQQSARLLWYHDHSYGITRLNVYVGEAAPYALTDDVEKQLIADRIIPGAADTIPLIVQDKTFVDATTVGATDPTWNWGSTPPVPHTGDLWMPHVYSPAQNPADPGGMNAYGRWHYGPWFWPPTQNITYPPTANPYFVDPVTTPLQNPTIPATPHPSMGMEAFHDTTMVNGTPYPVLEVDPKAYRFRILNAASDRFFNLQMYLADPTQVSSDGRTLTEVKMVPAVPTPAYATAYPNIVWPTDGREGGAPDPATAGPEWVQFGSESGFLPTPAIIPQQPITWNADPTTFNMGNVQDHSLLVAPAERADVVVDFSAYAGQTLILYNDAPTAFPALDARTDYYTGAPDMTDTGGTKTPQVGFGPSTRTVMQIRVKASAPAPAYNRAALMAAFTTTATQDGVFKRGQNPIIIPDSRYDSVYNDTFVADPYVRIYENATKLWTVFDGTTKTAATLPIEPKAIQDEMGETFDPDYGRMSGKFGLQIPGVGGGLQNLMLYDYADKPTENLTDQLTPLSPVLPNGTQIWRFTHNGVDTHPVHFHLYDVQLINRVGWDGAIRPPDDNELGWKDTVRVSPLEDTIFALKPVAPKLPFGVPESIRPLDPTMPPDALITYPELPAGSTVPVMVSVLNADYNFGWEYVFHCHILSHEEMDMMRPVTVDVGTALPTAPDPIAATAAVAGPGVDLTWVDATPAPAVPLTVLSTPVPSNEYGFRIERAPLTGGVPGAFEIVARPPANTQAYTDATAVPGRAYQYRVVAVSASGDAVSLTQDYVPAPEFTSYVITPSAGPNGTISPALPVGVPTADPPTDVTFTFTPDPGYHVDSIVIDGGMPMAAAPSHTFTAVAADHTIHGNFAINEYPITASAGPNGTIAWSNVQNPLPAVSATTDAMVQHAKMYKTYEFLPDPGYQVAQVLVNGVPLPGKPTYYTFSNVTAAQTISVSFEIQTFTITPTAIGGGTITPSVPTAVTFGTDQTFTMTPNPGFHLSEVRVDGALVPTTNTYTFTNVQAAHTISATFVSDRMMPVYRFYNLVNGSHFYTASVAERDHVAATWPTILAYEGVAYSVNLDNPANADPLYRFYRPANGTHFYTASLAERDHIMATWPGVLNYEGIAYNVSAVERPNTVPVYRFFNVVSGSHFYTISVAERDHVIATWPGIFNYEGVAFHVGF